MDEVDGVEEIDEEEEDVLDGEADIGDAGVSSMACSSSSNSDVVACAYGRNLQFERRCCRRRVAQSRQRPPGSLVRPLQPQEWLTHK